MAADDKRTQIGGQGAPLPTPAPGGPSRYPAPTPAPMPQSGQPTSILPDHGANAHAYAPVAASASHPTSYLPPTTDPMIGATLAGRYHITKKLGEGGMGAVYLATHNLLEKQVALKVLHGEFARKPDLVERFMQEAKSASRIRHENVIDISDFGTTPEGMVFFAMELLKGHDLHEEIARARLAGQLLPWARSKRIFLQICSALSAAHSHGIIHRDLKPENVYLVEFLGEPDFVKLLDFGIAKLTEASEDGGRKLTKTGMLFGTPEYMSPEQARGEMGIDHRVDVYAMGCILFQLVTGRVPFEADNFMGVLSLHLTEQPPSIPPEVFDRIGAPRGLAAVIDRALAKDKHQRWGTIDEFAHAVRAVCGDPMPSASLAMAKQATVVPTGPGAKTGVSGGVAVPATTTQSRQKTQWTGNLQIPQEEDRPQGKSKLPLIIGLVVLLGGGAAAAFFALNKKGGDTDGSGSSGSNGSNAVVQNGNGNGNGPGTNGAITPPPPQAIDAGVAQPPPPAIDAAPALPPPPAMITFKIDSVPRGAEVTNVATGKKYGSTPVTLNIKGSHDTLSFQLHKNGFGDTILDLTPDQDGSFTAKLEKGEAGSPIRQTVTPKNPPGTGTKPDGGTGAVTKPDGGSGTKPPDGGKGSGTKPPDDDDCVDMPCVKKVVPGLQNGSGSGG